MASERVRGARNARRRAREFAVQGLYQWLLSQADTGVILADLSQSPGYEMADQEHLNELITQSIENYTGLHERLVGHLDRPVEQVSPVERAVLLVGAYEMLHRQEIPYRVVINEAIELAKVFGGTDGHKFVNGVLDRLASEAGLTAQRR